ncbi:SEFIR domain-containing protein [Amycolatopsis sp. GA6-003]|uniref:toll/interleukin-1 receptor domain-containing protein n=1 Tax=Amycolatopsis sp. GA6-003 TaxID=2652444 RepID=UPI003916FA92
MRSFKVFVSYAHDDEAHRAAVRKLAELLVRNGIDAVLDQWAENERKDWGAWANHHITTSDFVLVVASPAYRRVGDGTAQTTGNRGAQTETALIRDLVHGHRETWVRKILPIVLPGRSIDEIPRFLQPFSADRYEIPALDRSGIEGLLRIITGQPSWVPPALGQVPHLPPRPFETAAGSFSPAGVQAVEPRWAVLAEPAAVQWRAELVRDPWAAQAAAAVELHLAPVGAAPLTAGRLRAVAGTLAAAGRAHGLFSMGEEVQDRADGLAAAWTRAGRDGGGSGLAVLRSGQRSAWFALPTATIGSVLDQHDVQARLSASLVALAQLELPDPGEAALAIGLEPCSLVWEGSLADRHTSTVSMPLRTAEHARVPADEKLPWADLAAAPDAVAAELTARLIEAFRKS